LFSLAAIPLYHLKILFQITFCGENAMSTAAFNTRKHPRVLYEGAVTIYPVILTEAGSCLEIQPKGYETVGHNLGEGGICFEFVEGMYSSIFKVLFSLGKGKQVQAFAYLIWQYRKRVGVQFVTLDAEDQAQVQNYVEKLREGDR